MKWSDVSLVTPLSKFVILALMLESRLSVGEWSRSMNATWVHVRLVLDIWSVKLFVSLVGRDGELLDSHLFFFDRYSELAEYYRSKGRLAKAEKLEALAETHYQAAPGDDEPPEAAAAAMPVPRPPIRTNAVSTTRAKDPFVGRPSSLVPSPTS